MSVSKLISLAVLAPVILSGCVDLKGLIEPAANSDAFLVSADPLDATGLTFNTTPTAADIDTLGKLAMQSSQKCDAFLNRLVLTENSTDTTLDMATLALSAVGTAIQPIATAHIFSAGSTITSGWKTAIDSDVFAKASIGNYAQAIQSTYYKDLTNYANDLSKVDPKGLYPHIEVYKIQSIHRECSLASAQASINASLQGGGKLAAKETSTSTNLKIAQSAVDVADVLTLSATSSKFGSMQSHVSAAAKESCTPAACTIISALAAQATKDFAKTDLSVVVGKDSDTVVATAATDENVTWTLSLDVKASKKSLLGSTNVVPPSILNATSGVTPGHAVENSK